MFIESFLFFENFNFRKINVALAVYFVTYSTFIKPKKKSN